MKSRLWLLVLLFAVGLLMFTRLEVSTANLTDSAAGNRLVTAATYTPTPTPTPVPGIVIVQSKAATAASNPSATFNSTPTLGNLLVAIVSSSDDSTPLTMLGWTLAVGVGSGNFPSQAIFYKTAGVAESSTVTASGGRAIQIFEVSGIATLLPLDKTATGTAGANISRNGGAFTCGSVTTAQASELIISGLVHDPGASSSMSVNNAWSSSFTERHDLNGNSVLVASAVRIVSATGTYSTGSNLQGGSGSGRARCQTATFKGA